MIQNSNNVFTRAFAIRWGLGPVQAMATGLGMSSTRLNQALIGCTFTGGVRNETTMADLTKLYRAVDAGGALRTDLRDTFFATLARGPEKYAEMFRQIVRKEADAAKKSAVVTDFLNAFDVGWKGGSYALCLTDGSSCGPYKADLSIAGRMVIPFKKDGAIVKQSYLFGDFVNDLVIGCVYKSGCAAETSATDAIFATAAEASSSTIRAALATWPVPTPRR
jgi:beta-lactamase family protein